jgi:hypothetical protein
LAVLVVIERGIHGSWDCGEKQGKFYKLQGNGAGTLPVNNAKNFELVVDDNITVIEIGV